MRNSRLLAAAVLPLALASAGSQDSSKAYVPPVMREAGTAGTAIFTLPLPPKIVDGPPPFLRHTPTELPPEFVRDSVIYLGSRLDQWRQPDAAEFLGMPRGQRPSVDDRGKSNGVICAYSDPLQHYREFELDFDGESGKLRTVFVYPQKMSWRECQRAYGASVSAAHPGSGRTFYSYRNRRLDVLVDAAGNVISLGIY